MVGGDAVVGIIVTGSGAVKAEAVVCGGDKFLVLGYLGRGEIALGSVDGVAVNVESLTGGDEGAVHLAIEFLNGLCGKTVMV